MLRGDKWKTREGVIYILYSSMKGRTKTEQFENMDFDMEWFCEWLKESTDFHEMYDTWKENDFKSEIKPSVDRIDRRIGYKKENIQIITWGENRKKHAEEMKSRKQPPKMYIRGITNRRLMHKAKSEKLKKIIEKENISFNELAYELEFTIPTIKNWFRINGYEFLEKLIMTEYAIKRILEKRKVIMTNKEYQFTGEMNDGTEFVHNIEAITSGDAIKAAPGIIADREFCEVSDINLDTLECKPLGVKRNTVVQCEGCSS